MEASLAFEREIQNPPESIKILFGRFLLPDQTEHACSVTGISVEGAEFRCSCLPPYGETIIAYLEHFGRMECVAKEATPGGFRVEFALAGNRRERFLTRQRWMTNKQAGQVEDERQYNRRQLTGTMSRIKLDDGRQYACEITDVSLTGAAVAVGVLPAIGSRVYLGKMLGKVVRHLDSGFAMQFLTLSEVIS